ncbi:sigma factor-like helix-turn-helix DNA-binding protein [Sedimentibacter sp.]|uniref:sigma factor-like helix-turn-helix DNA-binding protein n=1 Tax=Sedimentibacter sp. TaxID=1960295 RepID=UPI0037D9CBF5
MLYKKVYNFIRLSKQNSKYIFHEQLYGIDPSEIINNHKTIDDDLYSLKYIYELTDVLTEKEKNIIIYIFLKGYSDVEIAKTMRISRQAVGKTKKRALQKLKCKFFKEETI